MVAVRMVVYSGFCGIVTFNHGLNESQFDSAFRSRGATLGGRGGAVGGHWVPNTDVYATDSGLVIKVELAGMKSESLEITVEGNRLRIAGTRPDCCRRISAIFS